MVVGAASALGCTGGKLLHKRQKLRGEMAKVAGKNGKRCREKGTANGDNKGGATRYGLQNLFSGSVNQCAD